MSDRGGKSDSALRTILIAVVIALIAGGSAPWWWAKLFPPANQNAQLPSSTPEVRNSSTPTPSPATNEPAPTIAKATATVENSAETSLPVRKPKMGDLEMGINRPGRDISRVFVPTAADCSNACLADSRCKAMTFVMDVEHSDRPGLCWLKDDVPPQESHPAMISAQKVWP